MTPEVRKKLMLWAVKGGLTSYVELGDLDKVPEEAFDYIPDDTLTVTLDDNGNVISIKRKENGTYQFVGGMTMYGPSTAGHEKEWTWNEAKERVFWELQE